MQTGVAVPLPPGSVSAHHSYCLHYAGANQGNTPRRAWIVVFRCDPVRSTDRWCSRGPAMCDWFTTTHSHTSVRVVAE